MQQKEKNQIFVVNHHYLLVCGWFLVMAFVVGCSTNPTIIPDGGQPTDLPSLAATITATSVPPSAILQPSVTPTRITVATSTLTPGPSVTPTSTSTESPISTPMPVATLTPLPTLDPSQRGQLYNELMSGNGGCMLPCWWGFELGTTDAGVVEQFYPSLGANIFEQKYPDNYSAVEALFVDSQIENGTQVRHSFIAHDGIVIEAEIQVVHDPNYQIESFLQRLGQPSEVWMWTIPEPYEGILPVRFRIYFPEQGIFVLYATGGEKIEEAVQVCFDKSGGTTLLLWDPSVWDPDGTKSIVDRSNEGGTAFTLEGFPIEEVSNWDTQQFSTILTDPTRAECLETPSNLWLSP